MVGLPDPESGVWTNEVDRKVGTAEQPVKVGDIIVTRNFSDETYHAQVIRSIRNQDGAIVFGLTESNYLSDKKIHHDRQLLASAPEIFGFVPSPKTFVQSRDLGADVDDEGAFGFSPQNETENQDHIYIIRGLEKAVPGLAKTPEKITALYKELDQYVDSRDWNSAARILLPYVKEKNLLKTLHNMAARGSLPAGWEIGEDGRLQKTAH